MEVGSAPLPHPASQRRTPGKAKPKPRAFNTQLGTSKRMVSNSGGTDGQDISPQRALLSTVLFYPQQKPLRVLVINQPGFRVPLTRH